jgi:hypothetical protein
MLRPKNYVAESLWQRADFFQVFPLDGGGYFSFMDIVGATDDRTVAEATLTGRIFERFRDSDGRVDWELHDRWDTIEMGVWLNRWYYLSSAARIYWLTGDEKYSQAVVDIVRQWTASVPYPQDYTAYFNTFRSGFDAGHRRINERACAMWCDFQLGQRILVAYWIAFFLSNSTRWTREDGDRLSELMIRHARLLYQVDSDGTFEPGNHQMLRGFALLHAAAMLDEREESKSWWDLGARLMTLHAEKDFTPGGVSREGSFSYQLFMLSQFAHAIALARAIGKNVPTEWSSLAKKMALFLSATATPALTTPVVNDGYEAPIGPVLDICRAQFSELSSSTLPAQQEILRLEHFSDAGVIVLDARKGDCRLWLLVECMPPYGHSGHWHAGKPTLHVWVNDRMLLGDAGCPSYDDPLYGAWFRRGPAHFAVTVDGCEDAEFISDIRWDKPPVLKIIRCERTPEGAAIEIESDGFVRLAEPVSYHRSIHYTHDGGLVVSDSLKSKSDVAAHAFALHIPFMVHDVQPSGPDRLLVHTGGAAVVVSWAVGKGKINTQWTRKRVSIGALQGDYPHLQIDATSVPETEFITRISIRQE